MSRRWRWCLVVVMAATVLGGFMPRSLLSSGGGPVAGSVSGSGSGSGSGPVQLAEEPPVAPTGCLVASCGRSAPVPANPILTIAGLAASLTGLVAYAAWRLTRRMRSSAFALPRGSALALFRPPQFS